MSDPVKWIQRHMPLVYHDSTAFTIVVHHSSLVEVISAAMGSTINNQSPSCSGPCDGLHGGRVGRSSTPDPDGFYASD